MLCSLLFFPPPQAAPSPVSLVIIKGENTSVEVKKLPKKAAPARFGRRLTAAQKARATHLCIDCGYVSWGGVGRGAPASYCVGHGLASRNCLGGRGCTARSASPPPDPRRCAMVRSGCTLPALPLVQIYSDETPFNQLPSDYRCPQV